jgi:hypothetical protein
MKASARADKFWRRIKLLTVPPCLACFSTHFVGLTFFCSEKQQQDGGEEEEDDEEALGEGNTSANI